MSEKNSSVLVDYLQCLSERNLGHVIELICWFSNYSAVKNMHLVCKNWNSILIELDVWKRLFHFQSLNNLNFRFVCQLNDWSEYMPKKIHFVHTDFKESLTALSEGYGSTTRFRIFLGGLPNVIALHGGSLICGMKSGLIKTWKPEDEDLKIRGKCRMILSGHQDEVTCLECSENFLASGGEDRTIRIWDLQEGVQIRILRLGIFSDDIRQIAFRQKFLLTFHTDSAMTSGTLTLLKINGFQNIQEYSSTFLTDFSQAVVPQGVLQHVKAFHITGDLSAVALQNYLLLYKVQNDQMLEQIGRVAGSFDIVAVGETGKFVFCVNKAESSASLYHVHSGDFIWKLDKLFSHPARDLTSHCQLTEFGFCAVLETGQIMVSTIDELVCADRKPSPARYIRFCESGKVRLFPHLTGNPQMNPHNFAFLVADFEEILFCPMKSFFRRVENLDIEEESLC